MAATIDVFELTNQALRDLGDTKANNKTKVSESVGKRSKIKRNRKFMENKRKLNKISCKKLKLESIKFMEDADEGDFDYTPDDDVVLVIDTEMEEVPETEEDALAAAEELVGNTVCKCSVCGANYVCECDKTMEEDIDGETTLVADEGVCPICGEEAPQIVVGEIVANEEPVEDTEDEVDDEVDVDVDVDVDTDDEGEEFDFDEEEDFEEGCSTKSSKKKAKKDDEEEKTMEGMRRPARSMRRPIRKENNRRPSVGRRTRRAPKVMENKKHINRRPMPRRKVTESTKTYNFNEFALNKLFTKFATENYSNVKAVKFNNGKLNKGRLTLEGVVYTTKGTKRTIKLVSENFKPTISKNFVIKAKEIGPFTEGAIKQRNRVPFVVECAVKNRTITPVSLKYSFTTKQSGLKESKGAKSAYKVYGKV